MLVNSEYARFSGKSTGTMYVDESTYLQSSYTYQRLHATMQPTTLQEAGGSSWAKV